jgi:hypothetical protein
MRDTDPKQGVAPMNRRASDPDLICMVDYDTGRALLPVDEYAPLLEQVGLLFDERDALSTKVRELEALNRCHLCPSEPVYGERGKWMCYACWQRVAAAA